jgi:NAD(P)-dependent dehydrogenase (short-subunit alcohol dehydrogenase family)
VVVADINAVAGQAVASTNAANMAFHKTDVTSAADWESVVEAAFKRFGRLDVVVNNAGTTYRNKVSWFAWIWE